MQKNEKQVQIPTELHRRLKLIAAETGTLRGLVIDALTEYAEKAERAGYGEGRNRQEHRGGDD